MRVIEIKTVDGSRFEFPEDRYAISSFDTERYCVNIQSLDFKKRFYFPKQNIAYIVEKDTEEG